MPSQALISPSVLPSDMLAHFHGRFHEPYIGNKPHAKLAKSAKDSFLVSGLQPEKFPSVSL